MPSAAAETNLQRREGGEEKIVTERETVFCPTADADGYCEENLVREGGEMRSESCTRDVGQKCRF